MLIMDWWGKGVQMKAVIQGFSNAYGLAPLDCTKSFLKLLTSTLTSFYKEFFMLLSYFDLPDTLFLFLRDNSLLRIV